MRYFSLLLIINSLLGATYYVDFSVGDDTANGTTSGTPWKHCPGDTNATSVPLAATLIAGDTVKFKGAIEYNGMININWSGSSNNRIIYDGNHIGDWGTGRAIIDKNSNTNGLYAFYADAGIRNLITIQGFEIREIGGYAAGDPVLSQDCSTPVTAPAPGVGISFFAGGTNLIFRNLYIHDIGGWRNQPPFSGTTGVSGDGINLQGTKNVLIDGVELSKMHTGIDLKADNSVSSGYINDITLTNVNIHNYIVWGLDMASRAASCVFSNITIRNSFVHDMNEYDQGNWVGCGANPHCDGLFIRTASMASTVWTNINIFNCEFYSDSIANGIGGTAAIYISQGPSANIYNCTFRTPGETRVIGVEFGNPSGTSPQYINIVNNSFLSPEKAISIDTETDPAKRILNIQNNIFYSIASAFNTGVNTIDDLTSYTLNYNLYWHPSIDATTRKSLVNNNNYKNFTQIQAINLELNGSFINPQYLSTNDFHITNTSPAFHTGTSFTNLFTVDKDGNARGTIWDIGAYQVFSAPTNVAHQTRPRRSLLKMLR